METLQHILTLVKPQCFMAIFDLQDAYLVVSLMGMHVKLLKFEWNLCLFGHALWISRGTLQVNKTPQTSTGKIEMIRHHFGHLHRQWMGQR